MDVLKTLALPQSLEHYQLVVLLAAISSLVFIPYLAFALGSSTLSYWLNLRGRRTGNTAEAEVAHILVDVAFYNKSVVAFLGLIPGLSLVFSFAQVLQQTPSGGVSLAGAGFICLLIGLWFLYGYRYTFRVQGIIDAYNTLARKDREDDTSGIAEYGAANARAHLRFGKYGIIFTALAAFLYVSAMAATMNTAQWTAISSVFDALLSAEVWLRFVQFLVLAAGVTGMGTLYVGLSWLRDDPRMTEEVTRLIRSFGLRLSVAALLLLPVVVIAGLVVTSGPAQAGTLYAVAGLALVLAFIAANFLYGYVRTGDSRAITAAAAVFFLSVSAVVANDYVAVGRSTKAHAAALASIHAQWLTDLKSELGVSIVTFTGEDIYNAKCSACHQFDAPKVGPAYLTVLPKYEGKKADLIKFVLNPVKVDPNFPSMPSQGLRPAEADSIAAYLLALFEAKRSKDPEIP